MKQASILFFLLAKTWFVCSFEPIDVVYTGIQKLYNVYSTSNTIAKQLNGYSDIENRVVDYSQLIK